LQTNADAGARLVPSAVVLPAFTATLFLSAGLMFLVEPMVAKMLLPRLGGSPAVWSTCLVFFQATLLLGYAYAHALTRWLPRMAQIVVHVFVVLPLAALVLPLDLGTGAPSPAESPPLWLILRLALAVGAPIFAISASAPLLQSWFAGIDHEAAGDPYFLYAGSNAGSLLALLAYPLLVEPALPLDRQAWLWSLGFGALALGIVLCAGATASRGQRITETVPREAVAPGSARERLRWAALAFVPSSLLLGVTAHIATDVVSAPLLWVVPLMLYLLTFILVFARRPPLRHAAMARVFPLLLITVVIVGAPGLPQDLVQFPPLTMAFHLGAFFAACMVCHGELARQRPPAARLTEFYFFLAAGGVLGGAFNALLAPLIFPGVWEYPLALIAACLLKPATPDDARRALTGDIVLPFALLAVDLLARGAVPVPTESGQVPVVLVAAFGYFLPAISLVNFSSRRWRFALGVAACLLAAATTGRGNTIVSARSFFGVYRVRVDDDGHMRALTLMNGTTLHGVRSLLPGEEQVPLAYFSREGPFGRFFAALAPGSVRHVAVIGLGTGEIGCYAQPGQDWTYYEIDPLVERIARDPRYFQFLENCGNHPRVVLGDARRTIADAPDGSYDVLILDAFSSDSIPMHLLTREALAMYLRKLAPGGRMLFHLSSRTLDLHPVVGALAADAGLRARILFDDPPGPLTLRRLPSLVVALAGRGGDLSGLDQENGWMELPPPDSRALWTDQRSDIVRAIRLGF
jgi:SAM-dependent methyltransferase